MVCTTIHLGMLYHIISFVAIRCCDIFVLVLIFKTVKIQTMSTARIEAFISEKQASGANTETVRCIVNVLNQIMKFAKKRGYIGYNPLADAEKPRGSVRSKGAIFDSDEINRLLNAESDPMYHCLFRLAVFSGARAGELLALRWCDVLWDSKQIRIERSYNNGALYQPKNETSRRKITLGDGMMQTLREWRKSNLKSELVFPDKEGKFHNSMAVLRRFRKTLNQAGLPAIRFHDLRHSFASLMLSNGENIKVIQSQLGHSTPTMTLNVYSHLVKNEVVVFY